MYLHSCVSFCISVFCIIFCVYLLDYSLLGYLWSFTMFNVQLKFHRPWIISFFMLAMGPFHLLSTLGYIACFSIFSQQLWTLLLRATIKTLPDRLVLQPQKLRPQNAKNIISSWPPKQLPLSTSGNETIGVYGKSTAPLLSGLVKKLVDVSGDTREHQWLHQAPTPVPGCGQGKYYQHIGLCASLI